MADSHGHDHHHVGHGLVEGDPNAGKAEFRTIFTIFIVLAILTVVEAAVAATIDSAILLMLIAFLKAALVVNFFMHIYRIWREDAH